QVERRRRLHWRSDGRDDAAHPVLVDPAVDTLPDRAADRQKRARDAGKDELGDLAAQRQARERGLDPRLGRRGFGPGAVGSRGGSTGWQNAGDGDRENRNRARRRAGAAAGNLGELLPANHPPPHLRILASLCETETLETPTGLADETGQ